MLQFPNDIGEPFFASPTVPPAGGNWAWTTPNNQYTLVNSIHFIYTSDANAANRIIRLELSFGGVNFFTSEAPRQIVASQVENCTVHDGAQPTSITDPDNIKMDWPQRAIFPGNVAITSVIANIQAGDTMTAIIIFGHRWRLQSI